MEDTEDQQALGPQGLKRVHQHQRVGAVRPRGWATPRYGATTWRPTHKPDRGVCLRLWFGFEIIIEKMLRRTAPSRDEVDQFDQLEPWSASADSFDSLPSEAQ